ncbi:hypothetical protein [Nocardia sp. NPDC050435]|uniref:hypothetical protein n=1 Tax=Nocardia sp. NPDC050435 TaxID=3155040 RepID=UPI0034115CC4
MLGALAVGGAMWMPMFGGDGLREKGYSMMFLPPWGAQGVTALVVGAALLGLVGLAPIPQQYLSTVLTWALALAFVESIAAAVIVATGPGVIDDRFLERYNESAPDVDFQVAFVVLICGLAAIITAILIWLIRELVDRSVRDLQRSTVR